MTQLDVCKEVDPGYNPGRCCDCRFLGPRDSRIHEWTWCPDILECRHSKIPACLLPLALAAEGTRFESETRGPNERDGRIYYAVLKYSHSQALAARTSNVFERMGIVSVEKLRSMPPEFFEALPKVEHVGPKMLDAVRHIRERNA